MTFRRIRDWIRVISPCEYLLLIVLILAGAIFGVGSIRAMLGGRLAWGETVAFLMLLVAIGTLLYAILRVLFFHPVENRPYGRWLAETPWRHPWRLPLGPVALVWQDVVMLGVLTAVFPSLYVTRLAVPVFFLLVYSNFLALTACRVGVMWSLYVTFFLTGCSVLALPVVWIQIPLAGLAYAAAYLGMRQLLQRFPFSPAEREFYLPSERERLSKYSLTAGWPLPPVRTERWSWSISQRHAALIGVMVAWLFFSGSYHFQDELGFNESMQRGLWFIVAVTAMLRLVIYVFGYLPPISVFGRIATRRFIIPGYDVVLVAPLAILATAWFTALIAETAGVPVIHWVPVTSGLVVWLALALPPKRDSWHLTGHHRIAYRWRAILNSQVAPKQ